MEAINGTIPIIDWDMVADDLSGENPRNFQYWWDETAGYYVGYVDIETDTSKEFVGAGDGHSGTFYINAGGLRRKITIHWANVASIDAMDAWDDFPFVGAFWRHDETGERLIYGRRGTWLEPETGTWTAEVIEGYGDDFIVLEKGKTLDDKVWTDREPGNAENYPVDSEETLVEGTGSIYFRIGLTGTINPTATRYGLIRVTSLSDIGTDSERYIFVRQGEAADYLLDPDYAFSPYNLAVPGGSTAPEVIDVGSRGGSFTQFPSQGGGYFQWNETVAYAPEAAVMWPSKMYSPYWSKPKEVCPPGYVTPMDSDYQTGLTTSAEPANSNMLVGYYADGFFDRRMMTDSYVGSGSNKGFIGSLFYSEEFKSIFFPAAGIRTYDPMINRFLADRLYIGFYWTCVPAPPSSYQVLNFGPMKRLWVSMFLCLSAKRALRSYGRTLRQPILSQPTL